MNSRHNLKADSFATKLAHLLIEHLHECDERALFQLYCFADYELRERDVNWEKDFLATQNKQDHKNAK